MESVTMSQYHYQPYERTVSKRRYGELIPNVYIPPTAKFQGTTTTGDAYQGLSGNSSLSINLYKEENLYVCSLSIWALEEPVQPNFA